MTKRTAKSSSQPVKSSKLVSRGAGTRNAARDVVQVRSERLPPRVRRSVPATQAKNRFGEILQTARDTGPVFIERHGQAQAVVLGIDTYNKLTSNERTSEERELDYWTREFDALHAKMQTRKARQSVDALFSATDAEQNRKVS